MEPFSHLRISDLYFTKRYNIQIDLVDRYIKLAPIIKAIYNPVWKLIEHLHQHFFERAPSSSLTPVADRQAMVAGGGAGARVGRAEQWPHRATGAGTIEEQRWYAWSMVAGTAASQPRRARWRGPVWGWHGGGGTRVKVVLRVRV